MRHIRTQNYLNKLSMEALVDSNRYNVEIQEKVWNSYLQRVKFNENLRCYTISQDWVDQF